MAAPVAPPHGGITNWTRLLMEYLDNYTEDVQYTLINTSPNKRVTENRNLFERIIISGFSMIKMNMKLGLVLKNKDIDVVHITTSGHLSIIRDIMFIRTARKHKVPVVYHIHFGRIPQMSKGDSIEWKVMKWALMLSTKVVAIDKNTLSAIENNNIPAVYIPNPVNLNEMPHIGEKKAEKVIMYLGWVIRAKGIEELLEAWQQIGHDGWLLCLAGPYSKVYMAELKKRFDMKDVIIKGELPHEEALQLLGDSGAFVLPSYSEGFPNVILEAMALRKPIIATRVGAIEDMLGEGCGMLLEVSDIEALKEDLLKVIKEIPELQSMGKRAQTRVYEKYSLEKVCGQYRAIWSACLR